jgi:hypothetical protein
MPIIPSRIMKITEKKGPLQRGQGGGDGVLLH